MSAEHTGICYKEFTDPISLETILSQGYWKYLQTTKREIWAWKHQDIEFFSLNTAMLKKSKAVQIIHLSLNTRSGFVIDKLKSI